MLEAQQLAAQRGSATLFANVDFSLGNGEMLVVTGGRERTAEEYARLFEQAGFRLARVIATPSARSILEGLVA